MGEDRNIDPNQSLYWTGDALLYLLSFRGDLLPMPLRRTDGQATGVDRGGMTFLIRDPEGTSVAGASVIVWRRRDHPEVAGATQVALGVTGKDGRVRLSTDATENLEIEIVPPGARSDLARYGPRPWDGVATAHTLSHGFTVSGEVVDAVGRPVEGARVYLATIGAHVGGPEEFFPEHGLLTDGFGRFRAGHEPAGRILVRAGRERADGGLGYVRVGVASPSGPKLRLELPEVDVGNHILATVRALPAGTRAYLVPPASHLPVASRLDVPEAVAPTEGGVLRDTLREGALQAMEEWRVQVPSPDTVLLPADTKRLMWTLWVPRVGAAKHEVVYQSEAGIAASLGPLAWIPGHPVEGKVTGVARPMDTQVDLMGPGGYPLPGVVDESGQFRVEGVPPGTWSLQVRVSGSDRRLRRYAREVAAGASVEIKVD